MNILIVNGSHRVGNTKRFTRFAEKVLSRQGHNVTTLDLLQTRFDICCGCLTCEETGQCVLDDNFTREVVPKLKEADGYVFASPVYFDTVPALFKNFIDRTNCLCEFYQTHPKNAVAFLVGQNDEDSVVAALRYLQNYADIMNMDFLEDSIISFARTADELAMGEELENIISLWFNV